MKLQKKDDRKVERDDMDLQVPSKVTENQAGFQDLPSTMDEMYLAGRTAAGRGPALLNSGLLLWAEIFASIFDVLLERHLLAHRTF